MQAMEHVLNLKKSVILLVPEIALTSQTIERLKARFQQKIAILHHRLSDGERFDTWHGIKNGKIQIAVGARSALFSPFSNLGLIIVDEEQESSYKQSEEMPCYNVRDVAIVRAKINNCPIVLGSATPCLESYHNALKGKYVLHKLSARATSAKLPKVTIVDMKRERDLGNFVFSDLLLTKIKEKFSLGEQIILFLNRRGAFTCLTCSDCSETIKCAHCDVSLTFHKGLNHLTCHLCGYTLSPVPTKCGCGSDVLKFKGPGTEQIQRQIHAIFPEIRTLRMDADTTKHKGSHDKLFKQFRSGKADILIGTQMIAKGLHFPQVTLVGILNTDGALNIPDFRASEHVYQLLTQVAGRSGRGDLPGEVIVQTTQLDHPVIKHASKEDYESFFQEEIGIREIFAYPPFSHLTKIVFSSKDEQKLLIHAHTVHGQIIYKLPSNYTVYPITPCGYSKIKDKYRYQCLIKGNAPLHLAKILSDLIRPNQTSHTRVLIDIDPNNTFS